MDEDTEILHDPSTLEGKLYLLLHRIKPKHVFLTIVVLIVASVVAILLVSPGRKTNLQQAQASQEFVEYPVYQLTPDGSLTIEGCEDGFHDFKDFPDIDVASIKTLKIRYLVLNAPQFSQQMKPFTDLESLIIENVWVNATFSRVYLPNLKKFIFHQYSNGKTDEYKVREVLKEILFFDKSSSETWDIDKDLVNLGMAIKVKVAGTKLIHIEPTTGEINVNTHYCQDVLEHFDQDKVPFRLTSLSLHWCPLGAPFITKMKQVGASLKYLFLNNAFPDTQTELDELISNLDNLEELHVFKRVYNGTSLSTALLPKSLKVLSITNIDLIGDSAISSITQLSFDRYITKSVVDNFYNFFPNVKSLALFNVTCELTSQLIQTTMITIKPETIMVTGFPNGDWDNYGWTQQTKTKNMVGFMLVKSGIGYDSVEISKYEANYQRYKRLAFHKIDTYAEYIVWDANPI